MGDSKILAIIGSPRKNGNTEILVDELLKGAKSSGILQNKKIILNDLTIAPCQACGYCRKSEEHKCKYNDDMDTVTEQMAKSDIWIFATPIYYSGPTAQFKIFMDRWYGIPKELFRDKKIVLVIPLGDSSGTYERTTVEMFELIIPYQTAILVEKLVVPGVGGKGAVKSKTTYLKKAYEIGLSLSKK